MSERDFAMALALLAEAFGAKLTPVKIEAYHRTLKDVPIPLLNAAVERAIKSREWFPKPSELLADADVCNKALVAAHPFEPCERCDGTGWEHVQVDGVPRVTRCLCWRAWQGKLAQLGATKAPLALPPARRSELEAVGDSE